jgi:hypothetical protein
VKHRDEVIVGNLSDFGLATGDFDCGRFVQDGAFSAVIQYPYHFTLKAFEKENAV